ncbi:EF-hand domain-containing protein [Candidatus Methylocalor cossyra]|uniref:EF-hand domain-containing protein n=1 Tax=Candidatus Methylocalor cossyra TaxID=3108543 RepID=A0ABM9NN03_9GAMM
MNTAKHSLLWLSAAWMVAASGMTPAADGMERAKVQNPEQRRAMSFKKADMNRDGFLVREEFAEANHLGPATPSSDRDLRGTRLMAAFQAMDSNGDRRVSRKEYLRYLEQNGG